MTLFAQTLIFGVVQGATLALLGAGLVAVHRGTRVVNFAHGAMATVATFVFATLLDRNLSGWLAALLAAVAGGGIGLAVDALVMRPLRDRPALTRTVASLGVLYALQGIVLTVWGGTGRSVPPLFSTGGFTVAGLVVSWSQVGIVATALALTAGLGIFYSRTRLGVAIRAVADEPESAELSGVRVERVRAVSWAIGGVTGAVAGVLLAPTLGLDSYTLTLLVIAGLAAALTGRLESLGLALVGGLGLGILTELVRTYSQRWAGSSAPSWINLSGIGDAVSVLWILGLLLVWVASGSRGLSTEAAT
jgi:branched-chain amino acid transport system permease protein